MADILQISAQVNVFERFSAEVSAADIIFGIIYLAGIVLFARWLAKTSLGKAALVGSVPRRNSMPFYVPFVPIGVYIGLISIGTWAVRALLPGLSEWQQAFLDNVVAGIVATAAVAVIFVMAREYFARRLKGFGIDPKTIGRDFYSAVVNLLSVWPIVLAALWLTVLLGRLIAGEGFHIEKHEALETLLVNQQWSIRLVMIGLAVLVAPLFEETLFRGLFQTLMRSFLPGAWLAIVVSSAIFATFHQNWTHWPTLFVLSMCMGYAYEKSGSLFRPIFIHAIFNAISILAAFNQ